MEQNENKLIVANEIEFGIKPDMPYAVEEALNRLRINLRFLGKDIRKIMITSTEPNEGKSFVSMNIWRQMVEAGKHSILVDTDMRNSSIVDNYQIRRKDGGELQGTSHYLSGDEGAENLEDILCHTELEGGDLLLNSNNLINPSLLLEGDRFSNMLDELAEKYRYVFVDSAPLGMVSDAERIGSLCDGVILVVRSNSTPRRMIRQSLIQLERAGCPLLGIVLNRVDASQSGYYSKRYGKYGYYSQYYGSEE